MEEKGCTPVERLSLSITSWRTTFQSVIIFVLGVFFLRIFLVFLILWVFPLRVFLFGVFPLWVFLLLVI